MSFKVFPSVESTASSQRKNTKLPNEGVEKIPSAI